MTKYNFKMVSESKKVLVKAYDEHCSDCCPNPRDIRFNSRIDELVELTGTYPVYGNVMMKCEPIKEELSQLIYAGNKELVYDTKTAVRRILNSLDIENWENNSIPQDLFDKLKQAIKAQDEDFSTGSMPECYKQFALIKKSSPKVSNLIASLLKWADRDPVNDVVMTQFNARSASQLKDHDLVLSLEPHRIVGMSAFGKFTSCQDWIRKGTDHDYHNYTHMSWANMLDKTVGILFIKKHGSESPETDDTGVEDMLARSLVRVLPLDNGQVVVYLHRIYGSSPHDQVMKETLDKFAESLPAHYHVVKMYDYNKSDYAEYPNKHGYTFKGFTSVRFEQDECEVTGGSREDCSDCNGRGHHQCDCCDGDGTVYTYTLMIVTIMNMSGKLNAKAAMVVEKLSAMTAMVEDILTTTIQLMNHTTIMETLSPSDIMELSFKYQTIS
jgi:hypothetical protein